MLGGIESIRTIISINGQIKEQVSHDNSVKSDIYNSNVIIQMLNTTSFKQSLKQSMAFLETKVKRKCQKL